jgi:hypothetical protein
MKLKMKTKTNLREINLKVVIPKNCKKLNMKMTFYLKYNNKKIQMKIKILINLEKKNFKMRNNFKK